VRLLFQQRRSSVIELSVRIGKSDLRTCTCVALCEIGENGDQRLGKKLPPQRDSTITSRLRSAAIYPRPATRTKRFTSSVQYFLLNYQ